jgi:carboxymethylenebutenolidase
MSRFLGLLSAVVWLPIGCLGTAQPTEATAPTTYSTSAFPLQARPRSYKPGEPGGPSLVEFHSGASLLHGWLWQPEGPGPYPAVVLNHGSEDLPGWKPDQAEFYVAHGFVLFLPHRRGQGRSKDAGPSINAIAGTYGLVAPEFTRELVAQSEEVMAAVDYVRQLPNVDPRRVAAVGCSLGGIEALFAAENGTGIVAAIDFAGASMTWSTSRVLQDRMKDAAAHAKVPVLFLQAENDFDTEPSLVLYETMRAVGRPAEMRIYPAHGNSPEEGHAFCGGGARPAWGDEVLDFLGRAMK